MRLKKIKKSVNLFLDREIQAAYYLLLNSVVQLYPYRTVNRKE